VIWKRKPVLKINNVSPVACVILSLFFTFLTLRSTVRKIIRRSFRLDSRSERNVSAVCDHVHELSLHLSANKEESFSEKREKARQRTRFFSRTRLTFLVNVLSSVTCKFLLFRRERFDSPSFSLLPSVLAVTSFQFRCPSPRRAILVARELRMR